LKTLHLTNSWHASSGGIATFYRALIDAANLRGQEIRLVVPAEIDDVQTVGKFGRIYHIQSPLARFNRNYRTIYPSRFLRPGSVLQRILLAERPALVEICDKYTLNYLGALLRRQLLPALDFRPVVVGLSCERMDDNFRTYVGAFPLSRQFCAGYMQWLYFPFFDHHIANSEYTACELREAACGQVIPRSTWIRPMGVDLEHLSPARRSPARRLHWLQRFGASERALLLLYVGRLVPEKNLHLLFDLLAHLAGEQHLDARLLVAGDGMERALWEEECRVRLPGRVLFLRHIANRNDLADLYANCDIFVHPNPREPFGIAPLEAMASGVPLVAPNTGGVTSYASLSNAWTVPADVQKFAAAIAEIRSDAHKTALKVRRALEAAQSYSWKNTASSFLDLYRELCEMRGRQAGDSPASFQSSPPAALRSAAFHAVSQAAEKAFLAGARLFLKPVADDPDSHQPPARVSGHFAD